MEGLSGSGKGGEQPLQRRVYRDSRDVRPRYHDLANLTLAKLEDVVHHVSL